MAGAGNILGQLAGGYVEAMKTEDERASREHREGKDRMLTLGKILLESPDVPEEYKGAIVQWGMDVAKTPHGKKLPSFDKLATTLPPVNVPGIEGGTVKGGEPGMTLTPPAAQPPTNTQGERVAPNGNPIANMLPPGALPGLQPPPTVLPGKDVEVPALAPTQLAAPGQFHMLTPEEKQQRALRLEEQRVRGMQAIAPGTRPEQVMGIKPVQPLSVGPGEKLIDPYTHEEIATGGPSAALRNKAAYEPEFGPGGEVLGVIDNTGERPRVLTPQEAVGVPDARKVLEAANAAVTAREERQEAKEQRGFSRQLTIQTMALQNALQKGAVDEARKSVGEMRKTLTKSQDQLRQDENRFSIMRTTLENLKKDPSNVGSFDAALLAFHMGMTVGQIKGMRSGQQLIELHRKARSISEDLDTAIGGWATGQQLSSEQRQNFLDLAQEKMDLSRQQAMQVKDEYDAAYGEYSGLVKGVTKGKVKTLAPPSTPAASDGKGKGGFDWNSFPEAK